MLENFTPGTTERLGYNYEKVREIKSDIIYASISGFGQSGPYKDLKGYDAVAQAMSGIMASTGEPDRAPVRVGPSLIDMGTGMYMVIGIMDALRKKDTTDEGAYLDFNLLDPRSLDLDLDFDLLETDSDSDLRVVLLFLGPESERDLVDRLRTRVRDLDLNGKLHCESLPI